MNEDARPSAMVVDDDALIVMAACDMLSDFGFRRVEACNAAEAIGLLRERSKGVTLLFSVAKHWPWIEIVIASANVLPSEAAARQQTTHPGHV